MIFFNRLIRFLTIRRLIICAFALALTGCAPLSGKAPGSHLADPSTLAAGSAIANAEHLGWPDEAWWRVYQDPQLDRLVTQATHGNPRLQKARDRVSLAQSLANMRGATRQPQLELDASSSRDRFTALQFIPPPWAGSTYWNNSVAASLSYDLDLWGRRESEWQSSLDESRAVSAEAQQVRIELENAIVRAYIRLAMAYAQHDVAESRSRDIGQRVAIEKRRESAGMGTLLAVSEAETLLPLAQAAVESRDEEIARLKTELAALAGEGPGFTENIRRPRLTLEVAVGLPDRLPANLVGRRPDVAASRWHVESSRQDIQAARVAFYPDVNLAALVGFQAIGFGQWLSQSAFMAGAGPALSLPIFDGGRRRAGLSAATSAYDMAVDHYNDTVIEALKEVSQQLVAFRSATVRMQQAQQALGKAQDAGTLVEAAYRAGLADYRRVLNSRDAVLKAQEVLAGIQAQRLEAYAQLMLALGGGST
ncbi:MAG: efflux transporter outer membrane subunit [Betaproteobacteria bacterium]|nr:efflux transporter outer membrane subunit [Betaproteobacteria bacterium]